LKKAEEKICCEAKNARCESCSAGKSVEEFCKQESNKKVLGCEKYWFTEEKKKEVKEEKEKDDKLIALFTKEIVTTTEKVYKEEMTKFANADVKFKKRSEEISNEHKEIEKVNAKVELALETSGFSVKVVKQMAKAAKASNERRKKRGAKPVVIDVKVTKKA